MGVQNQLKLKPAALQLIVQYYQLNLAKLVDKQSAPINRKERARKVGFMKPPSKITSGLPSCRHLGV